VTLPGLYLDEDTHSAALVAALRERGVYVLTTSEAGMSNSTDQQQLDFARSRDLVLVTCNIADFVRLHCECLRAAGAHAGIIVVRQQRWGPGELARRIIRLLIAVPGQKMQNRLEFASAGS
jgi:predicted nuclease of predicted toxin-antitoxin system